MNDLALLSVPQSSRAALLRWVALGLACYQQQQPRDAWETENDWWQQHWPPANGPLADCIRDLNLNISGIVIKYDNSRAPQLRLVSLVCGKGQVQRGTHCGKKLVANAN